MSLSDTAYRMIRARLRKKNEKYEALLKMFIESSAEFEAFIKYGPTVEQVELVVEARSLSSALSSALPAFEFDRARKDMKNLRIEAGKLLAEVNTLRIQLRAKKFQVGETEESQIDTRGEKREAKKSQADSEEQRPKRRPGGF
jgi:hypothetical protein